MVLPYHDKRILLSYILCIIQLYMECHFLLSLSSLFAVGLVFLSTW